MKLLIPAILLLSTNLAGQQTVGLFLNDAQAFDGYTLMSPNRSNNSYLIDNCGRVVHEWLCSEKPRVSGYLLPNGNLLRTVKIDSTDWRYAADYPGFDGRDLTPGAPIELSPLPSTCVTYPLANCPVPANPLSTLLGATGVKLTWDDHPNYFKYKLQGRQLGSPGIANRVIGANSLTNA